MKRKQFLELINCTITPAPKNGRGYQGLRAGGSCRGICTRHAIRTRWGQKKYESGLKFCSHCRIWFSCDGLCCVCCGKRLRYKRRDKKIN
ncbi:MAG: hypothetical protein OEL52_01060 [Nitrosopumilus sp.]|nr:hypothetical protein [Nitrosopumilus sp.]